MKTSFNVSSSARVKPGLFISSRKKNKDYQLSGFVYFQGETAAGIPIIKTF